MCPLQSGQPDRQLHCRGCAGSGHRIRDTIFVHDPRESHRLRMEVGGIRLGASDEVCWSTKTGGCGCRRCTHAENIFRTLISIEEAVMTSNARKIRFAARADDRIFARGSCGALSGGRRDGADRRRRQDALPGRCLRADQGLPDDRRRRDRAGQRPPPGRDS